MYDKVTMTIKGRDVNGGEITQTIPNINPAPFDSTDAAVIESFKADCKKFAIAIGTLTTNTYQEIFLESTEDITTAGE